MSLDLTGESIAEIRFRNKNADKFKELLKLTNFKSSTELDTVLLIYFKLQIEYNEKSQNITRSQFRKIFHYCFNIPDFLWDRIFIALERTITPTVTIDTWAKTMSLYLRGTFDDKITYCFNCYDIQGDGIIRRDQMIILMKNCVFKEHDEDAAEAVKDFVDIIIKKMDIDQDGAISFFDYHDSVKRAPALLECFGQCLPDRASIYAFLITFTSMINKF